MRLVESLRREILIKFSHCN